MQKKIILFYAPFIARSRDTESVMLSLLDKKFEVYFLSQQPAEDLVEYLSSKGIRAYGTSTTNVKNKYLKLFISIMNLIIFCWKYKINIVYSHLDSANFTAVFAQYLVMAKIYLVRHYVNEHEINGLETSIYYKCIRTLGLRHIVVSEKAKTFMIEKDGVSSSKIQKIKLAYDFLLYPAPEKEQVKKIRNNFSSDIILLSVMRLVELKRPLILIDIVIKLIDCGIEPTALILGDGPLRDQMQKEINKYCLNKHIFLLGHNNNVMDYYGAADVLIHPSVSESSCVVTKEAALVCCPVIVCKHVGDFEEYIEHEKNGFLIEKDKFTNECVDIIMHYMDKKESLNKIGANLKPIVSKMFAIEEVIDDYLRQIEAY